MSHLHSYSLDSFGVETGTHAIQLYIKTCLHRTYANDSYSKSVFLARRTLCGVQRFNGHSIIYRYMPVRRRRTTQVTWAKFSHFCSGNDLVVAVAAADQLICVQLRAGVGEERGLL